MHGIEAECEFVYVGRRVAGWECVMGDAAWSVLSCAKAVPHRCTSGEGGARERDIYMRAHTHPHTAIDIHTPRQESRREAS